MTNLVSIQSVNKQMRPFPQAVDLIISMFRKQSKNTAKSYLSFYKEFFIYTLNKQLQDVTWDDVLSISYDMVLEYVDALSVKNKSKTIHTKVASLQSLYKELHKINRAVDIVTVSVSVDITKEKDNSWGSLTSSEVDSLYSFCESLDATQKPYIKRMFFETAFITAIRKSALLDMTWEDINLEDDGNGNSIWVITVADKTGVDKTPITNNFYEKLALLKTESTQPTDRVFDISDKTLRRTLAAFCTNYGIAKERNIVIHSLKKASMDKVFFETRDITATAAHGHHKGVEMSYRNYLGKNKNLSDRPSYNLFENENSEELLSQLSKEELLEIIMSCPDSISLAIINKAREIKKAI